MWGQLFPRLVRTWEGHDRLVWWLLSLPQQEAFQRPLPQDTSPTANGSPWNLGYPPTWHLPCREMSDLPSLPIPHEAYQTGLGQALSISPLCPGPPALSRWVRAYTKSPGTLLSYVLRGMTRAYKGPRCPLDQDCRSAQVTQPGVTVTFECFQ